VRISAANNLITKIGHVNRSEEEIIENNNLLGKNIIKAKNTYPN
jgi:ribosomal protein L1